MNERYMDLKSFLKLTSPELVYTKIKEVGKKEIKTNIENLKAFHNGKLTVNNTTEQGDLLEDVIVSIIKHIEIFSYVANEKTSSNEVDLSVRVNRDGELLLAKYPHLVPECFPRYFRIECKNYRKPLGITYVNKFHSLLENQGELKLGFMMTYFGLTGEGNQGWYASDGLVKKIALRHCVDSKLPLLLSISVKDLDRFIELDYDFFEWIGEMRDKLLYDVKSDFQSIEEE